MGSEDLGRCGWLDTDSKVHQESNSITRVDPVEYQLLLACFNPVQLKNPPSPYGCLAFFAFPHFTVAVLTLLGCCRHVFLTHSR